MKQSTNYSSHQSRKSRQHTTSHSSTTSADEYSSDSDSDSGSILSTSSHPSNNHHHQENQNPNNDTFTNTISQSIQHKLETHFHTHRKIVQLAENEEKFEREYREKIVAMRRIMDGYGRHQNKKHEIMDWEENEEVVGRNGSPSVSSPSHESDAFSIRKNHGSNQPPSLDSTPSRLKKSVSRKRPLSASSSLSRSSSKKRPSSGRRRRQHTSANNDNVTIFVGKNCAPISLRPAAMRAIYSSPKRRTPTKKRGRKTPTGKKKKKAATPQLQVDRLLDSPQQNTEKRASTTLGLREESTSSIPRGRSPLVTTQNHSLPEDESESVATATTTDESEYSAATMDSVTSSLKDAALTQLQSPHNIMEKDQYREKLQYQLQEMTRSMGLDGKRKAASSRSRVSRVPISSSLEADTDLDRELEWQHRHEQRVRSSLGRTSTPNSAQRSRPQSASVLSRRVLEFGGDTPNQATATPSPRSHRASPRSALGEMISPSTPIVNAIQEANLFTPSGIQESSTSIYRAGSGTPKRPTSATVSLRPSSASYNRRPASSATTPRRPISARARVQSRNSTKFTDYSIDSSEYSVHQKDTLVKGIYKRRGSAKKKRPQSASARNTLATPTSTATPRVKIFDRSQPSKEPQISRDFDSLHESLQTNSLHELKQKLSELCEFPTRYEYSKKGLDKQVNESSKIANGIINWIKFGTDPLEEVKQISSRMRSQTPTQETREKPQRPMSAPSRRHVRPKSAATARQRPQSATNRNGGSFAIIRGRQ